MVKYLLYFLLFITLVGPSSYGGTHTAVTPEIAKDIIGTNELKALDTRVVSVYCEEPSSLPNTATYPLISGKLQEKYEELPLGDSTLVVYLRGNQSSQDIEFLDAKGYSPVYDIQDEMPSWKGETEESFSSCPSEILLQFDRNSLYTLRKLRDEILLENDLGVLLTTLYYIHASEISTILFIDQDLKKQAISILVQLISETKSMLDGENIVVKRQTINSLGIFLEKFAGQASPQLQATIRQIKNGITEGVILNQFGIQIDR